MSHVRWYACGSVRPLIGWCGVSRRVGRPRTSAHDRVTTSLHARILPSDAPGARGQQQSWSLCFAPNICVSLALLLTRPNACCYKIRHAWLRATQPGTVPSPCRACRYARSDCVCCAHLPNSVRVRQANDKYTNAMAVFASRSSRALILCVLTLSYCSGAAATLCPVSGSSGSINCYRGFTLSAAYKALPWCNCTCVQGGNTYFDYLPVTTQFACNNATCSNALSPCGGGYSTSQSSYVQMATDPLNYITTAPSITTPDVNGSICLSGTFTCSSAFANNASTANPWCNSATVGASYSEFDAFPAAFPGDATPVSACANRATDLASDPNYLSGYYSVYTCITDKCNAIPPPAVSSDAMAMVAHQSLMVSVVLFATAAFAY